MNNNQKILIYIAISAVSIFVIVKLFKGKNQVGGQPLILQPDGQPIRLLPNDITNDSILKVKTLLEAKRASYEKLWKQSGSKLSFKDWYIENAE